MPWLKVVKDAVTPAAILFLVGFTIFTHFHGSSSSDQPAPHSRGPDPAAVKLGSDYARALTHAAADTIDASASRSWRNTAEAAQQNLEDFDERLAKAWKPVAAEMNRRFGPASDQSVDFNRESEIRQFWRDVAAGIRKETRP